MERIATNDIRHHLEVLQKISGCGNWELNIADLDTDRPQYWSEEMFRMLGYDPDRTIPSFSAFLDSIHPGDRDGVTATLMDSIRHGEAFDREQRHILPDGRTIITRNVAKLILDKDTGKPLKLCGAVRDVTEEKEVYLSVERSNKEMRTFFETIDEVLYSVDTVQYKVLQMSPACETVYGYTVKEMTENPMKWLEVVLEEDRHIIDACEAVMKRGETATNEHRILHKDGSVRWVSDRLIPTLDESGSLIRIDGVCMDISARKEAEFALKRSETKFRTLLENSSDGIIVTNADGKIIFGSSSILRITGYSDNLGSIDVPALFHPDDRQKIATARQSLLNVPGCTGKFVARFCRKDGSWMWMEGVSRNLFHDPAVGGILTNFRDVTERLEYEDNLRSANEHLKKTNQELDRFVYSASHDLRAPLASLLGLLEYTETESELPQIIEGLAMMRESVKKLDGFVLDILDYSKNSRLEVQAEAIDFEELIKELVSNAKFMGLDTRQVSINWKISGKHRFYSDRIRLKMMLSNLISNAIQYANPEVADPYVAIEVTVSPNEAIIVIRDNGSGIDQKFHSRIFDMFYRVSSKSVGSGLGLYIVKEAVEKVNGRLEFVSEPGIGSEFSLIIPNFGN